MRRVFWNTITLLILFVIFALAEPWPMSKTERKAYMLKRMKLRIKKKKKPIVYIAPLPHPPWTDIVMDQKDMRGNI
jgi:hypothetical protein